MNRLNKLFSRKQERVLNIYTTAGYPQLNSTVNIVLALEAAGADIIELGMPYSDPMADGATIQASSAMALKNGMDLKTLFEQVRTIRQHSEIPLILMGYLNQLMQFGKEKFVQTCKEVGVDGLIIPDIPMEIFEEEYKDLLAQNDLGFSFLVTPQTSTRRIIKASELSTGFLYVVSSSSITGSSKDIENAQVEYFQRLSKMKFNTPKLIGFGIHDKATFNTANQYANGAIIGSAFIREIEGVTVKETQNAVVNKFISEILDK